MIFFSSGSCAGELWGAKIKSCSDSLCVGRDTGKSRKDILVNQELPSPFLVLSTTKLTMMGIRQMGVMTRAKTVAGGGSLNSSVGHSLKYVEWISTNICSTSGLGHGIWRQSDISSVQMLKLLYKLLSQKKTETNEYCTLSRGVAVHFHSDWINIKIWGFPHDSYLFISNDPIWFTDLKSIWDIFSQKFKQCDLERYWPVHVKFSWVFVFFAR